MYNSNQIVITTHKAAYFSKQGQQWKRFLLLDSVKFQFVVEEVDFQEILPEIKTLLNVL